MLHVGLQLAERGVQVFAARLHFNGDFAFPDVINVACLRAGKLYSGFKIADGLRVINAENVQKACHKALRLRFFIARVFPAF